MLSYISKETDLAFEEAKSSKTCFHPYRLERQSLACISSFSIAGGKSKVQGKVKKGFGILWLEGNGIEH
jgi:hypothetical protein